VSRHRSGFYKTKNPPASVLVVGCFDFRGCKWTLADPPPHTRRHTCAAVTAATHPWAFPWVAQHLRRRAFWPLPRQRKFPIRSIYVSVTLGSKERLV